MAKALDALIVGGGPAGLAAGIVMARAGLRVLLAEQQTYPVDKACGEGLMPSGVQHLEQLGVSVSQSFPFVGVRYQAPDGRTAQAHFREGPGAGIRRTVLSQALLDEAERYASLSVMDGVRARPQTVDARGVVVEVGEQRVRARLLIGADGLHSRVRGWAGLDRPERRHWRWGARQHYRLHPWSEFVEVTWSGNGVEAYVTPVAADEVGVAFLWHRKRVPGLQGGAELLPSLRSLFPTLERRLAGASAVTEVEAVGPLQQRTSGVIGAGVLLLGDAAGYVDAITGEGLSLAFAQALALRETVLPVLQRGSGLVPRQKLSAYEQAHTRLTRGAAQLIELALLLSRFPRLCNWVTAAFERDSVLFQHLLSANMGRASLWHPVTGARLAGQLMLAVARTTC